MKLYLRTKDNAEDTYILPNTCTHPDVKSQKYSVLIIAFLASRTVFICAFYIVIHSLKIYTCAFKMIDNLHHKNITANVFLREKKIATDENKNSVNSIEKSLTIMLLIMTLLSYLT